MMLGTDLAQWVRDGLTPSPLGGISTTPDIMGLLSAGYGSNLLRNGGFENWSGASDTVNPDIWSLTGAGSTLVRDIDNAKSGVSSCTITVALNTTTFLTSDSVGNSLTISATQNQDLRGIFVSLSAWVKASVAGRVYIQIDDAVGTTASPFHSGSGNYELLTVVRKLDPLATVLRVQIYCLTGPVTTITVDSVCLVKGETPVFFTPNPSDFFLQMDGYQNTVLTNRPSGNFRSEIGVITCSAAGGVTVTFATAFSAIKAIYGIANVQTPAMFCAFTVNNTSFIAHCFDDTGARQAFNCYWLAIGIR